MKKLLAFIIFISLISCEDSKYCTDTITGMPDQNLISESDLSTVSSLFGTIGMSLNKYLVFRFQTDQLGGKHVKCYQYVNNIKIFSDEIIFHFDSQNRFTSLSGEIISTIDINSVPKMSKNDVVKLFLELVDEDGRFSSRSLKNECIQCEIGYYDLNAGTSNQTHNFKLTWKIRGEDSVYPFAYINDTDKSKIYYDNGVRY